MRIFNWIEDTIARVMSWSLASLALRVALAVPFFKSGLTKWDGFGKLSETAVFLFQEEFKLYPFGPNSTPIDYPFPVVAAYASSVAEIILPIMLVLGLLTRISALGLLVMTFVIQLTIWSGWPLHLTWAAMALGILALGPGKWSLDHLWRRAG